MTSFSGLLDPYGDVVGLLTLRYSVVGCPPRVTARHRPAHPRRRPLCSCRGQRRYHFGRHCPVQERLRGCAVPCGGSAAGFSPKVCYAGARWLLRKNRRFLCSRWSHEAVLRAQAISIQVALHYHMCFHLCFKLHVPYALLAASLCAAPPACCVARLISVRLLEAVWLLVAQRPAFAFPLLGLSNIPVREEDVTLAPDEDQPEATFPILERTQTTPAHDESRHFPRDQEDRSCTWTSRIRLRGRPGLCHWRCPPTSRQATTDGRRYPGRRSAPSPRDPQVTAGAGPPGDTFWAAALHWSTWPDGGEDEGKMPIVPPMPRALERTLHIDPPDIPGSPGNNEPTLQEA